MRWVLLMLLLSGAVDVCAAEDPVQQAYAAGEAALRAGQLATARSSFSTVLRLVPEDVGARVNLGVIAMREKKWDEALGFLHDAETRAPQVPGIRLNIGLAEYRKGDYAAAIAPFESVLRDQPQSSQARHLLGLCYLFVQRYGEAAQTLEPLWPSSNSQLPYLYSLAVAAGNAGMQETEQRALVRLMDLAQDSPLLHLLKGKALLAREDFGGAVHEFDQAAKGNPKLPLVHYNLGVAYRRQGHPEEAEREFLADAAMEPGIPYDYDQLGALAYARNRDRVAESYFHKALGVDPRLGTSWFGLAKVLRREGRLPEALNAIERACQIDAQSASARYLRAQLLTALGRHREAQEDMAEVRRLQGQRRDNLQQQFEHARYLDAAAPGVE